MVTLEPYNRDWPRLFDEQARMLGAALGSHVTEIEHIGSTAIPGLTAKPIIDLAAQAAADVDPFELAPALEPLEYYPHRSGPKNHAVYIRGTTAGRTEILHVFEWNQWQFCNQRIFRDKLLHDASARGRYGELKIRLAASIDDGMDYTNAKRKLIQELLNEEQTVRGIPLTKAWDK